MNKLGVMREELITKQPGNEGGLIDLDKVSGVMSGKKVEKG